MTPKIHTDSPDCDCGRCEPASPLPSMSAGALVSHNPACDWPACAIRVEQCKWGPTRCFDEPVKSED